jgi:hypothetical protein
VETVRAQQGDALVIVDDCFRIVVQTDRLQNFMFRDVARDGADPLAGGGVGAALLPRHGPLGRPPVGVVVLIALKGALDVADYRPPPGRPRGPGARVEPSD